MVYHAEELLGIAFIRNSIIGSAEKKGQWELLLYMMSGLGISSLRVHFAPLISSLMQQLAASMASLLFNSLSEQHLA